MRVIAAVVGVMMGMVMMVTGGGGQRPHQLGEAEFAEAVG
jgi:hypothetical protein